MIYFYPYSHVFDNQFLPTLRPGVDWHHEQASQMMLDHLILENDIEISDRQKRILHAMIHPPEHPTEMDLYGFEQASQMINDADF